MPSFLVDLSVDIIDRAWCWVHDFHKKTFDPTKLLRIYSVSFSTRFFIQLTFLLGQVTKFYPKFHLTRRFLTNTNIVLFQLSLLCLNFSLLRREHTNISLFCLNFSLLVTFPVKFSLFQPATLPRRPAHSHAGRPFLCRRPALYHVGPPNEDIAGRPTTTPAPPMTWLIPCHWRAGAHPQITARHAKSEKSEKFRMKSEKFAHLRRKSEKFKHKSEKFTPPRRKNEKFKPKVRNPRVRAGKVRNSNQPKVRNEIFLNVY